MMPIGSGELLFVTHNGNFVALLFLLDSLKTFTLTQLSI